LNPWKHSAPITTQSSSSWTWNRSNTQHPRWIRSQSAGLITDSYYNKAIPGNPTIASIEEIDAAIKIFTSAIKSAKNALKNYITHIHLGTQPFQGKQEL
jgi:hypothetical protein